MPLHIAHRGYSGKYPENTAVAFEKAIEVGVDMIETDLRLSKDKVWLIQHDESFVRTHHLEEWVSETLAKDRPENVLTFLEALNVIDGKCSIYLDIKNHPTKDELRDMLNIICQYTSNFEQIYCGSFRLLTIQWLNELRKEMDISIKIGYIGEIVPEMLNSTADGCLNLTEVNFSSTHLDLVNREYLNMLRKHNIQLFVYTLNTKFTLSYYNALGVDGLLTDEVDLFQHLK